MAADTVDEEQPALHRKPRMCWSQSAGHAGFRLIGEPCGPEIAVYNAHSPAVVSGGPLTGAPPRQAADVSCSLAAPRLYRVNLARSGNRQKNVEFGPEAGEAEKMNANHVGLFRHIHGPIAQQG